MEMTADRRPAGHDHLRPFRDSQQHPLDPPWSSAGRLSVTINSPLNPAPPAHERHAVIDAAEHSG